MNINIVKEELQKNIGREVEVKIYGMRNKTDTIIGKIEKLYPKLFIVSNNRETRSINYADVITKETVIKYLWFCLKKTSLWYKI